MRDPSLDRVLELNDLLLALSAAGVPVDLGESESESSRDHQSLRRMIERANASLRLRVELGQPIEQAVEAAAELTPRHRTAVQAWLRLEEPSAALDGLTQPPQRRSEIRRTVGSSLLQFLILGALVYLALMVLCVYTLPRLESLYRQLGTPPDIALTILQWVRDAMPIWIVGVPLMGLLAWIAWRWRAPQLSWQRLPGCSRFFAAARQANYADQLATLLESGLPLERSMQWAGPMIGAADGAPPYKLPPLLHWAVNGDVGGEPRPVVLRFVADTYRRLANERAFAWRLWLPTLLGAVAGGLLVLAYGWSLFLPITQLLQEISLPRASRP